MTFFGRKDKGVKTVDEYVASLDGWKAEVVATVRKVVRAAAPGAKESIKWAQPVWELHGPFAYVKAFKGSVNFGFWRGSDLDDPRGLLQGTGDKMRHVKLTSLGDIDERQLERFVRQAVELNVTAGDPTKRSRALKQEGGSNE